MGKLSWYVTSHPRSTQPGHLSVGRRYEYQSLDCEDNRRSGHASQTIVVYPPTGSTAYIREITPSVINYYDDDDDDVW